MISIDLRWINISGMGTYLRNVVPPTIRYFSDEKFHLIGKREEIASLDLPSSSQLTITECDAPMYSLREQWDVPKCLPKETSLFFATHYNIPLLYRGRMIVTVYDLCHLAIRERYHGPAKRAYARFMLGRVRSRALRIMAISEFTKSEFCRFIGCSSDQITVVPLGVNDAWFSAVTSERPRRSPYVIYVGNIKPHKNLARAILAFEQISAVVPHDLIIVGRKEGFITGDSVVPDLAGRLGDRIQFTGYIADDKLRHYVAHADLMVFPSLYEGFGLPPLEAMAAGCPVVASRAGSLPEVCGDAAVYCDPRDPSDIAQAMLSVLLHPASTQDLRTRGMKRARGFSWSKTVQTTCVTIEEALRNA